MCLRYLEDKSVLRMVCNKVIVVLPVYLAGIVSATHCPLLAGGRVDALKWYLDLEVGCAL